MDELKKLTVLGRGAFGVVHLVEHMKVKEPWIGCKCVVLDRDNQVWACVCAEQERVGAQVPL